MGLVDKFKQSKQINWFKQSLSARLTVLYPGHRDLRSSQLHIYKFASATKCRWPGQNIVISHIHLDEKWL